MTWENNLPGEAAERRRQKLRAILRRLWRRTTVVAATHPAHRPRPRGAWK